MAIVWGPTINDRWKVGIEITQTASTDSTVTLRADYFFWARYDIRDSNNSFSASGSFGSTSGSRSVSTSTSGGTISLGSQSKSFSRAYGSASSVSQSISFSGLEAVGATLTASASYTIPARAYSKPPAPTNLVATRSGTSASVSWTNNHSASASAATYASTIYVDSYYQNMDGTSQHITQVALSNTTTSYTATGLDASRAVTFGITAVNNSGANVVWAGWVYPTPTAPTGCTSTRNSDIRNTVSWANTAPNYPSTSVLIERSTSGGAFVQIATVGGTATSYVDNGASANNYYRYRVRTRYGDKYSGYSTSGYTYNTPAKPSNVRAAKNADNSVTVSWQDNARTETGHSLQRSQDGGATWVTVTSSIAANATSYTDTAAPGGSLTYRVEAHRQPLYSGWSAPSPSITTIAPPLAPTITDYPRATVSTADGGFTIGWLHNPVDGSTQTAAEIAILPPDSTETFDSITGTASTYRVDTTATGTYRISVRTKGAHADWSPWAPHVYVTLADPPVLTIDEPAVDGETVVSIPMTTSWTYTDSQHNLTELTYAITDETGRTTLSVRNPEGSSLILDASTWMPSNKSSYTITITARAASGLTTVASRIFTTDYAEPVAPIVTVTTDKMNLAASIQLTDGAVGEDDIPAISYTVIRVTRAGTEIIATELTSGAVVSDPIPPINRPYTYRVIAHAASGAISEANYETTLHAPSFFAINYGSGFGSVAMIDANAEVSRTPQKSQELAAYQGRSRPVLHHNPYTEHELRLSGDIFPATDEAIAQWEGLEDWYAEAVYRDNRGNVTLVSTQLSWTEPRGSNIPSVEVNMVEVVLP